MKVFSRSKQVGCEKTGDYTLKTVSAIVDTIHEMEVVIVTDMRNMEIVEARSSILRAPYSFCRDISGIAGRLAGLRIDDKIGSNVKSLVGGADGCYQLADLCLESIKAIKQCGYAFIPGGHEELLRNFDAVLRGTCYSHCRSLEEKIKESRSPNVIVEKTGFSR
ncbi:MAG: DUF2889 domain-containing protein [Bacillota bacterium]